MPVVSKQERCPTIAVASSFTSGPDRLRESQRQTWVGDVVGVWEPSKVPLGHRKAMTMFDGQPTLGLLARGLANNVTLSKHKATGRFVPRGVLLMVIRMKVQGFPGKEAVFVVSHCISLNFFN